MAAEGKGEVKQEQKKAVVGKEDGAVEENPEPPPLKYKKWVLKVSVHCEACKKKVKKILHNIEGVYIADVDLKQQKATVIGKVELDAETLIKKLVKKTGRHAELWPEKADHKEKKKGKSKNKEKEKQSDQESGEEDEEEEEESGADKEKETSKVVSFQVQDPSKSSNNGGGGQGENVAAKSGGGSHRKKKKKKKGHKGNNNNVGDQSANPGNVTPSIGPPQVHALFPAALLCPAINSPPRLHSYHYPSYPPNHSPPRHHMYDYSATHYHAPSVQVVNYRTANPSISSYGASCHAPPYEYEYMHPRMGIESPPSDSESYSSQPHVSFEVLSDENPNACTIM